jgi:RNA polymerase sigma-70 factor (ECF subfamily)
VVRWTTQAARSTAKADPLPEAAGSFHDQFARLFEANFPRLHRVLNRLSGESELAADVVQEAFVRLYRRGSMPDAPEAWLVSVALNLLRNEKSARNRRLRLLTPERGTRSLGDSPPDPEQAAQTADIGRRVRRALDLLSDREQRLLLLSAEGYRYRDIAVALRLHEASIGVMLARARRAFRERYEETPDAPR